MVVRKDTNEREPKEQINNEASYLLEVEPTEIPVQKCVEQTSDQLEEHLNVHEL